MALRVIVAVLGLLIVLVGLMEIVAPDQILVFSQSLMRTNVVRWLGVVELVLGVVLIVAALRRAVGLTTFVLLMGSYLVVLSVVMFVAPGRLVDIVRASVVDASPGAQIAVLWMSGLLRILLGSALFWGAILAPRRAGPAELEHP